MKPNLLIRGVALLLIPAVLQQQVFSAQWSVINRPPTVRYSLFTDNSPFTPQALAPSEVTAENAQGSATWYYRAKAKMLIPSPLRQYAHNQDVVEVSGHTVSDAFQHFVSQFEELRKHLYDASGKLRAFIWTSQDLNAPLHDGDTIGFAPRVAGGSDRRHDNSGLAEATRLRIELLGRAGVSAEWTIIEEIVAEIENLTGWALPTKQMPLYIRKNVPTKAIRDLRNYGLKPHLIIPIEDGRRVIKNLVSEIERFKAFVEQHRLGPSPASLSEAKAIVATSNLTAVSGHYKLYIRRLNAIIKKTGKIAAANFNIAGLYRAQHVRLVNRADVDTVFDDIGKQATPSETDVQARILTGRRVLTDWWTSERIAQEVEKRTGWHLNSERVYEYLMRQRDRGQLTVIALAKITGMHLSVISPEEGEKLVAEQVAEIQKLRRFQRTLPEIIAPANNTADADALQALYGAHGMARTLGLGHEAFGTRIREGVLRKNPFSIIGLSDQYALYCVVPPEQIDFLKRMKQTILGKSVAQMEKLQIKEAGYLYTAWLTPINGDGPPALSLIIQRPLLDAEHSLRYSGHIVWPNGDVNLKADLSNSRWLEFASPEDQDLVQQPLFQFIQNTVAAHYDPSHRIRLKLSQTASIAPHAALSAFNLACLVARKTSAAATNREAVAQAQEQIFRLGLVDAKTLEPAAQFATIVMRVQLHWMVSYVPPQGNAVPFTGRTPTVFSSFIGLVHLVWIALGSIAIGLWIQHLTGSAAWGQTMAVLAASAMAWGITAIPHLSRPFAQTPPRAVTDLPSINLPMRMDKGKADISSSAAPARALDKGKGGSPPDKVDPSTLLESLISGTITEAENALQRIKRDDPERFNELLGIFYRLPDRHSFKPGDVIFSWAPNGPLEAGWIRFRSGNTVIVSQYKDLTSYKAEWNLADPQRQTYLLATSEEIAKAILDPGREAVLSFITNLSWPWVEVKDSDAIIKKIIAGLAEAQLKKNGDWNFTYALPGDQGKVFEYSFVRLGRKHHLFVRGEPSEIELSAMENPIFSWAKTAHVLSLWLSKEALKQLRELRFHTWQGNIFEKYHFIIKKKEFPGHMPRYHPHLWLIGGSLALSVLAAHQVSAQTRQKSNLSPQAVQIRHLLDDWSKAPPDSKKRKEQENKLFPIMENRKDDAVPFFKELGRDPTVLNLERQMLGTMEANDKGAISDDSHDALKALAKFEPTTLPEIPQQMTTPSPATNTSAVPAPVVHTPSTDAPRTASAEMPLGTTGSGVAPVIKPPTTSNSAPPAPSEPTATKTSSSSTFSRLLHVSENILIVIVRIALGLFILWFVDSLFMSSFRRRTYYGEERLRRRSRRIRMIIPFFLIPIIFTAATNLMRAEVPPSTKNLAVSA